MTLSAILTKLEKLLAHGIRSEAEAVYLLAETRKLLEQQDEETIRISQVPLRLGITRETDRKRSATHSETLRRC
jgi:hypothetical protein